MNNEQNNMNNGIFNANPIPSNNPVPTEPIVPGTNLTPTNNSSPEVSPTASLTTDNGLPPLNSDNVIPVNNSSSISEIKIPNIFGSDTNSNTNNQSSLDINNQPMSSTANPNPVVQPMENGNQNSNPQPIENVGSIPNNNDINNISQTVIEPTTNTIIPVTPVPETSNSKPNNIDGLNNNLNVTNSSPFDIGLNEQTPLNTSTPNQQNTNIGTGEQNSTTTNNVQAQPINNQVEEDLLKIFIGKNFEKITKNKFNFAGLFFGFCYLFYRKMFLYGLILFILSSIVSTVTNNFLISIAFNVLVGVLVNKIYISHANKKINGIKNKNPQINIEELKIICAKKGGTSIGLVFLGLLVNFVIAFIILMIMMAAGLATAFTEILSMFNIGNITVGETNNSGDNIEENNTFNGAFSYNTSVILKNEFEIVIPSQFNEEGMFNDENHYDYEYSSDSGVFDSCSISFAQVNGYNSAENLLNQMIDYYKNDALSEEITNSNINNVNWHWFAIEGSFGTTYYYGTTKNNKVFLLEYEIEEDASEDCLNYKDSIINSIKSK